MRISKRGQITIPKRLRDRYGLHQGIEVEIIPTKEGLLVRKAAKDRHPVERICGILRSRENTDDYIETIRGR
ncbi:MAG: AbrB/MazE/SpoVT family DNA-binding domain-containing protein [Gemmatimonadetes bacterium]|nr:AbrB/MazE/SpoVT family DNA-binding domain-containing protein [Gemmatimonadota bacterium]